MVNIRINQDPASLRSRSNLCNLPFNVSSNNSIEWNEVQMLDRSITDVVAVSHLKDMSGKDEVSLLVPLRNGLMF